jgi:hypothetical protein
MVNLIVGVKAVLKKTTETNTNQNLDILTKQEIVLNVIRNTRLVSEGNQFFVQGSAKINIEDSS